jgi:hypothetical protein
MNYAKHYNALMSKARLRGKPAGYAERHHVVPRSLSGTNDKSNLVWLTAREHFVAHVLLAKIHGGSQWFAVMMFAAGSRRVVNGRLYDMAKRKHAVWMSENFRGVPHTTAHKAAISRGMVGNKNTAGRPLSEQHKASISTALKGNQHTAGSRHTAATKAKMSVAHLGEKHHYFGKQRDPETRAKISAKLAGVKRQPRSEETKARIRAGVLAANAVRINPNP